MRPKEIQKLIELVEKSKISELEVSRWGKKVRILKYPENNKPASGLQENIIVTQAPAPAIPEQAPIQTVSEETKIDTFCLKRNRECKGFQASLFGLLLKIWNNLKGRICS